MKEEASLARKIKQLAISTGSPARAIGKSLPNVSTGLFFKLVADDAEQILDVVKKILRNCGYTFFEAKDGETCMRVFQCRGIQPRRF